MAEQQSQTHLLIVEDDNGRREFLLEKDVYFVGKSPDCHLRLSSPFVSRRHATLERFENSNGTYRYQITDGYPNGKPSANGIIINGRKVTNHNLQDKDEIIFGPHVRVTYHLLKRESVVSAPDDEFDITLISPSMIDEDEELDTFDKF
ncbi:MAG TPA: FHA domain-containing protein [Coleofasciculaceae cyanobacterium]